VQQSTYYAQLTLHTTNGGSKGFMKHLCTCTQMHNKITQAIEICKNKCSTQKIKRSVKCFRKIPLNNASSSIVIKLAPHN